ncbi:MAG: Ppx/GppA family phosphatase [Clostridia bacterium]|nr:Ppx/GppA family phosphatase [Clostridia bacterium]
MAKKIGIIDLGSNSIRLVIFEIRQNGAFKLIDDISDNVRLSEGMIEGKYLNDFAMRRAVRIVKMFKNLCMDHGVHLRDIIPVATAAVRKAENKENFLKLIQYASGLKFKVLSGEEEALYVYNAVVRTMDVKDGIIVDIGGGSTEVIKVKNRQVVNYVSIPIGAVVATEEFLGKDTVVPEKLQSLEEYIKGRLQELKWLTGEDNEAIVGLGGTIRNFAEIHKKQNNYTLELMHNYCIALKDFFETYDYLGSLDLESRRKIKGISSKRADIIVGGLAILKAIAVLTNAKVLHISGNGLREGILFEYVLKNKSMQWYSDALEFSLNNCMQLYDVRQEHARHVCDISLSLFDQLGELHGLGENERKLLRISALLHDIGISISYYDHHIHSFYVILHSRLNGLTHRETLLVAAVAASHGNKDMLLEWSKKYKGVLKLGDVQIFTKLSMFLRIAECLDRSETGIIKALECQICESTVKIKTIKEGDAELELSLANEKNDSFKKIFRKSFVIS